MGIREIRERMERRKHMERKAAELKLEELEEDLKAATKIKGKLEEIAEKYGVIIATSPKLQSEISRIREKYGIPESAVITHVISEEEVLKKKMLGLSVGIDYEKLGLLLYQRALLKRKETGGIMTLGDAYLIVNTGRLRGKVKVDDVERAIKELEKRKVIPGLRQLRSGVKIVVFIPAELSDDQNEILSIASEKGYVTPEDVMLKTGWSKERVNAALTALEESGIARKEESYAYGEKYYFPGLMG